MTQFVEGAEGATGLAPSPLKIQLSGTATGAGGLVYDAQATPGSENRTLIVEVVNTGTEDITLRASDTVEDAAQVIVRFRNGVLGNLQAIAPAAPEYDLNVETQAPQDKITFRSQERITIPAGGVAPFQLNGVHVAPPLALGHTELTVSLWFDNQGSASPFEARLALQVTAQAAPTTTVDDPLGAPPGMAPSDTLNPVQEMPPESAPPTPPTTQAPPTPPTSPPPPQTTGQTPPPTSAPPTNAAPGPDPAPSPTPPPASPTTGARPGPAASPAPAAPLAPVHLDISFVKGASHVMTDGIMATDLKIQIRNLTTPKLRFVQGSKVVLRFSVAPASSGALCKSPEAGSIAGEVFEELRLTASSTKSDNFRYTGQEAEAGIYTCTFNYTQATALDRDIDEGLILALNGLKSTAQIGLTALDVQLEGVEVHHPAPANVTVPLGLVRDRLIVSKSPLLYGPLEQTGLTKLETGELGVNRLRLRTGGRGMALSMDGDDLKIANVAAPATNAPALRLTPDGKLTAKTLVATEAVEAKDLTLTGIAKTPTLRATTSVFAEDRSSDVAALPNRMSLAPTGITFAQSVPDPANPGQLKRLDETLVMTATEVTAPTARFYDILPRAPRSTVFIQSVTSRGIYTDSLKVRGATFNYMCGGRIRRSDPFVTNSPTIDGKMRTYKKYKIAGVTQYTFDSKVFFLKFDDATQVPTVVASFFGAYESSDHASNNTVLVEYINNSSRGKSPDWAWPGWRVWGENAEIVQIRADSNEAADFSFFAFY
ncbi:hypothetical protein [Gymnodinialimonas sp.]